MDRRRLRRQHPADLDLDNYRDLATLEVYRTITVRTLLTAAAVTVIDALLAFPIALYMAKVASRGPSGCWWWRS